MNPQIIWDQLLCAYAAGDWDTIEERATVLIEWLDHGGSPPKILSHPGLGPDWDRILARAGCAFALETVQGRWSTLPW
jgi:hypothetical protein